MDNQTHEPSNIVTDSPKQSQKSFLREALSTIGVLVVAFLVAVALISFVFQSYQVDGPSMQTTLYNQDRLIVWKLPRTWARITRHQYVPQRGDVIVFTESGLAEYGQNNSKQLIKRVIGLPGDHVVVKNGVITIYNKQHPDGFIPDKTLPYGKVIPYTAGNIDLTLGKNQLYVCGDNRPDSLDSRTFGPINTNQVVGKLVLRVFPLNDVKTF
ncbi:MAG TPA: signal peptidase I [Candidatus Saccharimonadales bacterium]|nr:signal peptidase I [Candidatus Saccharimonadales bacterium]